MVTSYMDSLILKIAFTTLIANRAIQWVVHKQKLKNTLSKLGRQHRRLTYPAGGICYRRDHGQVV